MTTKLLESQLHNLAHEMVMLRSVVIGVIGERDPEGEYRPEFVSRMLQLAKKKQTGVKFTASAALMKIIG